MGKTGKAARVAPPPGHVTSVPVSSRKPGRGTSGKVIPIAVAGAAKAPRQQQRLLWQAGFFVLFIMAPVFDLFRYDLVAGHAWFLGMPWKLGISDFLAGRISAGQAALNLFVRLFLPILATGGALIFVSWRWGRLYCGWLCPHFSVVETINALMRRASGKQSVWERPAPTLPDGRMRQANGHFFRIDPRWWFATLPLAVAFAFLWAVVLLTYLLPPFEVYGNLPDAIKVGDRYYGKVHMVLRLRPTTGTRP